jgi:hypothetical protein
MSRYTYRLRDVCEINSEIREIPSITNAPSSMGNSMLKPRETTPPRTITAKRVKERSTADICV